MKRFVLLGLVGTLLLCCLSQGAITISTYISAADSARLKALFSQPAADIAAAHYSALGLVRLGQQVPKELCKHSIGEGQSPEWLHHASSLHQLAPHCPAPSISTAKPILAKAIKEGATALELYHAVSAQVNLGIPVDSPAVSKLLTSILEKDDSISNLGYSFHIASHLKGDLRPFYDRIEDAVVQSDEVNGKYLQFEGGLSITANILSGMYELAKAHKKAPTLTSEQVVKFTNYLLSRKYVQAIKGASQLLNLLTILTNNPFHVPVAVTLASSGALSAAAPKLKVEVTDVLGKPLPTPVKVTADSMVREGDSREALRNAELSPLTKAQFQLDISAAKPPRGFYKLLVSAQPQTPDSRLAGNLGAELAVKVLTELSPPSLSLGAEDRDDSISSSKLHTLQYGQQLTAPLEADFHQKLVLKFSLKDKQANTPMAAHQVFVQLSRPGAKEVVVVAELDSSTALYRAELDLLTKAKDFGYVSGNYQLSLIVGDAVVSNPFVWKLGEVKLTLPSAPAGYSGQQAAAGSVYQAAKPEIRHQFRPLEKRAPAVLSTTFSVLVVAVPWLVLLVSWLRVGANVSDICLAPLPALGFHSGLAGIFALFVCFWLKLNMFTTLKYLAWIGAATFLFGHRLFTRLATAKSQK